MKKHGIGSLVTYFKHYIIYYCQRNLNYDLKTKYFYLTN